MGTPRGSLRGKSFVYVWIQLKVATGKVRHPLGAEKSPWKEQEPLKAAWTPWKWQGPSERYRDLLDAAGISWKLQGPPGFCRDPWKWLEPPRSSRDPLEAAGILWKLQGLPGSGRDPREWQRLPKRGKDPLEEAGTRELLEPAKLWISTLLDSFRMTVVHKQREIHYKQDYNSAILMGPFQSYYTPKFT